MAKSAKELYEQLVSEGMEPGTPVNAPSRSVWVQDDDGWKMYSGRDGSSDFNRFEYMPKYRNAMLTENGQSPEDAIKNMDDYDLFNSIYYIPESLGRPNYVEGEQERIWNELNKYFDLPRYNPYMYGFGVNGQNRTVNLYRNGVYGSGGFGDWLRKPKDLGTLKRR